MEKWESIEKGPYTPDWDSLRQFECPEWFRDAKLGIWAHWGPQSVPMFGDWYARNMYREGTDQYIHHWRTYGHPSKHGWKDVVKEWKAEKFDAEALMRMYVDAGAKYFVAQAVHHDNFDNWDSAHNKWNSVNVGPKRDIVGEFKQAADKFGLPFGLTEHLGATFSWWSVNKGADSKGPFAGVPYDGNEKEYEDFYLPNQDEPILDKMATNWYTQNPYWHKHWFDRIKDLVDKYKPNLLYSDGPLPFDKYGLGIVAHLYNTSIREYGEAGRAVYNQKDHNPLIYKTGVLDIERGVMNGPAPDPWQTDTCVKGWFYDVRREYKSAKQVIEMLVDIVAKNGNLLLNFTQKPDGSLDDECLYILEEMKKWMAVNSEGIFGTRPWGPGLEGELNIESAKGFHEPEMEYQANDFRFTQKDGNVYVFALGWPEDGRITVKSFTNKWGLKLMDIGNVELLGFAGKLKYSLTREGLEISGLPSKRPGLCASCFKVSRQ